MSKKHTYRRWTSLVQMRLLSVGSFLMCLVVLAILALLQLITHTAERSLREQIEVSAELYAGMSAQAQTDLLEELKRKPYVLEPRIITAEQALEEVTELLGEDPRALLGYNPLTPVVEFRLSGRVAQGDSLELVERELQELLPNLSLKTRGELVGGMQGIFASLRTGLQLVGLVALVFALVQISTTIQLTLRLEKHKIRILSLVGASSWFIIRPIVGRAVLDGFLAWLACLALLGALGAYIQATWGIQVASLLPCWEWAMVLGAILALAVLLPAVIAYRASHKYLRMEEGRLILH